MSTAALKRMTYEEYRAREELATEKSEFYDGEVFAIAGGGLTHSLVKANLVRAVGNQLSESPCRVLDSDMQVRTATMLHTYPDLSVVCEQPQFADETQIVLLNPLLICEVLSKSTESYDRGKKSEQYRSIPSLMEYLLVSPDRPVVEHYARQLGTDKWLLSAVVSLDGILELPCLNCRIPLREIYAKVEFKPADDSETPVAAP